MNSAGHFGRPLRQIRRHLQAPVSHRPRNEQAHAPAVDGHLPGERDVVAAEVVGVEQLEVGEHQAAHVRGLDAAGVAPE
jgi:hypothetical protein